MKKNGIQMRLKRGKNNLALASVIAFAALMVIGMPSEGLADEGCGSGYWKNHLDSWVGYNPAESFVAVLTNSSFADVVTVYDPVSTWDPEAGADGLWVPTPWHSDPLLALGPPDYDVNVVGPEFVSLGVGGSITLQFTDNFLTGDGTTDEDLWIFEEQGGKEDVFVEISDNGTDWHSVGTAHRHESGPEAGIDIDSFGFGPSDIFTYVRLTDVEDQGADFGVSVGADIDAVGANSTLALLPALKARGGGFEALKRQAVAALLNIAHPDVRYQYTEAEVFDMIQGIYASGGDPEIVKNQLEVANELYCPLD